MRAPRPLDWLPEAWLFVGMLSMLVAGSLQPGPIVSPGALWAMAWVGFCCWWAAGGFSER